MKMFAERNLGVMGLIGVVTAAVAVVAALQYDKVVFFFASQSYSAYFAEAGGLHSGDDVQVAGFKVGKISGVRLDGRRVLVEFDIDNDVHLGDATEAAIKSKTLLGKKFLDLTPRGKNSLTTPIPEEHTASPYQLPDALGDLSATISGLDMTKVSDALSTLSETFQGTPPDLKAAVDGLARFSDSLDKRDAQLRNLLANANKVTTVLGQRGDELRKLVGDTNSLLAALLSQSGSLDQIAGNLSAMSQQVSGLVAENRTQLRPALEKLNGVLTMVDNRKDRIRSAIKYLSAYAMSLGESVASGPYFKSYLAGLAPGQFVQPFVDAAFSDLGLDPNVLLPSQLTDPQTGQPGTPPLPLPYPRTGQGGDPRLTLPDAITGKPGDPRYPYREPPPAPPPGGPPPGPPAVDPANPVPRQNESGPVLVEPSPVGPSERGR
jgi:phospholipid/cholesterol/gamma-HCH transport system substrate-binding protein